MLREIFSLLEESHKRQFFVLIALTILFSVVELVGISLIMPFIQMAVDFSQIHSHKIYQLVYSFFAMKDEKQFVIAFGTVLVLFYMLRGVFNLFYYKSISYYIRGIYFFLSVKLFKKFVGMDYRNYIEKNSANLIQTISTEANNLSSLLQAAMMIFGEFFVIIFIYGVLLYVNWKLTLLITLFLTINILILTKTVTKKIKEAGEIRAKQHKHFYEILSSTFGNFKMIKLQSEEKNLIKRFTTASKEMTDSHITNETLQHVPRLFLESISFILVIGIILYWIVTYSGDVSGMMGVLTLFIMALYRLMPSVNRIMTNYNSMQFHLKSLELVKDDLKTKEENLADEKISFEKVIELKNVSFSYEKDKKILDNINLTIKKGQKVAFVGESGGGKSTLVDIIIGLLREESGDIMIDGVKLTDKNISSWREKIGYIPQDVYLFDASVAENVTFLPRDQIDTKRVVEVLKQAEIYAFLQEHQEGIDTIVGEGGVKLSGGQKQRIAIARALYHKPEIIVMDEATSALDNETEKAIMKKIYEIADDKTMLMIAHRLSTIEGCDVVYEIESGVVKFCSLNKYRD